MAKKRKSRKGLKANGRLKKGYRYTKRGTVVKAKKKAAAKKKRPVKRRRKRCRTSCSCMG